MAKVRYDAVIPFLKELGFTDEQIKCIISVDINFASNGLYPIMTIKMIGTDSLIKTLVRRVRLEGGTDGIHGGTDIKPSADGAAGSQPF